MKHRCCIYGRMDTLPNEMTTVLMELQCNHLKCAASSMGLEVVTTKLAYESGTQSNRQSILNLIHDAKRDLYDCIIVTDLSRLARTPKSLCAISARFAEAGLKVFTPGGEVDPPLSLLSHTLSAIQHSGLLAD